MDQRASRRATGMSRHSTRQLLAFRHPVTKLQCAMIGCPKPQLAAPIRNSLCYPPLQAFPNVSSWIPAHRRLRVHMPLQHQCKTGNDSANGPVAGEPQSDDNVEFPNVWECVPGPACGRRKLFPRRSSTVGKCPALVGERGLIQSKTLGREVSSAMALSVSKLIQALEPSATMAMAAKAKELKASGRTVYDLSLGEPDFPTPEHICQAAIEAMKAGHTHYTVASGIPELKRAVVDQYRGRYGLSYPPQYVVISNGAKHAIHNALVAVLNPGDEVIIPAPYWVSYSELVKLTGAVPVIVPTEESNGFKLTPEVLQAAITPKTRMLLLCTPSNPTGTMYSRQELEGLARVVLDTDLVVLADEIYDRLTYTSEPFASFPTVCPGLQERTILINGVSKTYAMTGWRIGWAIAPNKDIAEAMASLQSQETSNPCSISQYAALAAITGPQDCVETMRREFERRKNFVAERLAKIPGVSCAPMEGAFYAFVNISRHLGKRYNGTVVDNSSQWCLELLSQKGVATVMGSAFGAEGYVRLSFAAATEELARALDLIDEFIREAK